MLCALSVQAVWRGVHCAQVIAGSVVLWAGSVFAHVWGVEQGLG